MGFARRTHCGGRPTLAAISRNGRPVQVLPRDYLEGGCLVLRHHWGDPDVLLWPHRGAGRSAAPVRSAVSEFCKSWIRVSTFSRLSPHARGSSVVGIHSR